MFFAPTTTNIFPLLRIKTISQAGLREIREKQLSLMMTHTFDLLDDLFSYTQHFLFYFSFIHLSSEMDSKRECLCIAFDDDKYIRVEYKIFV